ncbi:PKD domain-containing protein, partial [bacterium]|nr:PKD domain-containing protein [bacterium]
SYSPYANESGEMLVVVAIAGQEGCVLEWVVPGESERRGTGGEEGEDPPVGSPPLYAPDLPPAFDLSPQCAPVNDQRSWNSCTAFAIGDGAFNYELNRIYGRMGWDFSNGFNRVSPKHLYVVSGELGGDPPDPKVYRITEEVAAGLLEHGVATDLNAPYDLVYDSQWSEEAMADAELLTISGFEFVPSYGTAGVETMKGILFHLRRVVFMRSRLDSGFFGYREGVWTYSGPARSVHVMCIVGYDDGMQAFKVRNSWGENWGQEGYIWVSYGTFLSSEAQIRCAYLQADYDAALARRFLGLDDPLPPPTRLRASNGTDAGRINLSWKKSLGATGYKVYRDVEDNLIATLGDVDTWEDTAASSEYSYGYWVTALREGDESYFSTPDIGYLAQPPAIESVMPAGGSAGQGLAFGAGVSGSEPLSYYWDFGGGAAPNTSDDPAPFVVFSAVGTYAASLTVTNEFGSEVYEFELAVAPNQEPVAYFYANKLDGIAPLDVAFNAGGSSDADGTIKKYEWSWDGDLVWEDETVSPSISHTFSVAGAYQVLLQVTDNVGLTATFSQEINAYPSEHPLAILDVSQESGPPPLAVSFSASDSHDPDGVIVLYEYDLDGDGVYETSGQMKELDKTYYGNSTTSVRLRVTDNTGLASESAPMLITSGLAGEIDGWNAYPVDAYSSAGSSGVSAALVGGKPALAVASNELHQLRYYYSTVAQPVSSADWAMQVVATDAATAAQPSLVDYGGQ